MEFILKLIIEGIFASLASLGFAMVFNVPKKTLKFCALGGALVYDLRTIFLSLNFGIEISTFFACAIIGMIALYWSRKYLIPRPVYTVASIIPVLPGTYAFTAMINIIDMNRYGVTQELLGLFIQNGLKAVVVLIAITFGLVLPSLYFIRLNRPVI